MPAKRWHCTVMILFTAFHAIVECIIFDRFLFNQMVSTLGKAFGQARIASLDAKAILFFPGPYQLIGALSLAACLFAFTWLFCTLIQIHGLTPGTYRAYAGQCAAAPTQDSVDLEAQDAQPERDPWIEGATGDAAPRPEQLIGSLRPVQSSSRILFDGGTVATDQPNTPSSSTADPPDAPFPDSTPSIIPTSDGQSSGTESDNPTFLTPPSSPSSSVLDADSEEYSLLVEHLLFLPVAQAMCAHCVDAGDDWETDSDNTPEQDRTSEEVDDVLENSVLQAKLNAAAAASADNRAFGN